MLAGIASILATVVVALYTALLLPSLQQYLAERATQWAKQREQADAKRHAINLTYLNPLRLWLEESYIRLQEIQTELTATQHCAPLLYVNHPAEVSDQDPLWFTETGCYLVSSCYITACLFFALKQVRDNLPYLRLSRHSDTELMTLVFQVSRAFLQDFGIYYVMQPSIGQDVYLTAQQRLMTYREFCGFLQDPTQRVWCDRLIQFYLDVGQGRRQRNLTAALTAIQTLSHFLDTQIGQGVSIRDRLQAEHPLP